MHFQASGAVMPPNAGDFCQWLIRGDELHERPAPAEG